MLIFSSIIFPIIFATTTTSQAITSSTAGYEGISASERNRLITLVVVFGCTLFLVLFTWGFCWYRRRKIKVTRRRAQSYPPKPGMSPEQIYGLPNLPSDFVLDVVEEPVQAQDGSVQLVNMKSNARGTFEKKSSAGKSSSSGATTPSLPSLPPTSSNKQRKIDKDTYNSLPSLPSMTATTQNSAHKQFAKNLNIRLHRRNNSSDTPVPSWRAYSESSSDPVPARYAITEYAESDKHCRATPGMIGGDELMSEPAPTIDSDDRSTLFGPKDWERAKEFNRLLDQLTDPKPTPGIDYDALKTGTKKTLETESTPDNSFIRAIYGQ